MNVFSHGGDLKSLAEEACRPERDILDFSVNLRPEGMPEFIISALWKAMENAVPYPSPDAADLRELAAVHYGIPSGCFVFGNGANELIHALPRALNLKQAVIPEPAFSEYRLACLRHGTDVLSIRTEERNSFLPSLCRLEEQAADGSAVFLANPSNPSGGLLDAEALHRVVQSRPEILWIIDESFMDYAQGAESLLREAALLPNLVVLRSLTKFYGMAGVRLGYCLCGDETLLEKMQTAGQPWAVSSLAQAAGVAALKETAYVDEVRALIARQRPVLTASLRALGLRVIDGKANYLLFRAPADLNKRLRPLGTQVRSCANYPGLGPEWYRTAVRTASENARLLELMKEVLG